MVDHDALLQSSRRVDWRFLLPEPDLGRVASIGPSDPELVESLGLLSEELVSLVDPSMDRRLQISGEDGLPGVVLVVGVNGSGKTTTVGKIARILVAEDKSVVLGAADTFRAAAVDQLATWGERVGVEVVRVRPQQRLRLRHAARQERVPLAEAGALGAEADLARGDRRRHARFP